MKLDLTSLKSVREFVSEFKARNLPLHLLINNAGVAAIAEYKTTQDGLEMQFGTNHVGHHYLTAQLLDVIEKSAPSRIVFVSSDAHRSVSEIPFDKLNNIEAYSPFKAYAISKAANILCSNEISRRLERKGVTNVYVNSLHPGVVSTEITRNISWFIKPFGVAVFKLFGYSPDKGALTTLYAATSPEVEKKDYRGKYFVPQGKLADTTALVQKEQLAKDLWEFTESLINKASV